MMVPATILSRLFMQELYYQWRARMLGARVAPRIRGKLPFNIDFPASVLRAIRNGYPDDISRALFEQYGPVADISSLGERRIITTCSEHIKTILVTDFNNFVKGPRLRRILQPSLGSGIFNSDGDLWKFHRTLTRPFVARHRISDFALFDRYAEDVIAQLKMRFREGYAVDFQDLMCRFTLDSGTEFLVGHSMHSLSAGLPYPYNVKTSPSAPSAANDFVNAASELGNVIANRVPLGWAWPLNEIWENKADKCARTIRNFLEPFLDEALASRPSAAGDEDSKGLKDDDTLLDHLVKSTNDRSMILDEILNIMFAARDTTAFTLTFVMYLLTQYPNIVERLRQEIMEIVGQTRTPTYEDLRGMKYLRSVINETLRLYPVVPNNMRECVKETVLASPDSGQKPIYVPSGASISYSVFFMHRLKDLWGPDAEEFDPDRFLDDRHKKYNLKNPFIFLPFNAGPRICLGQQFAYNEMSFVIVKLIQHFKSFSLDMTALAPEFHPPAAWKGSPGRKGTEKVRLKTSLAMSVAGGLWVKMEETN